MRRSQVYLGEHTLSESLIWIWLLTPEFLRPKYWSSVMSVAMRTDFRGTFTSPIGFPVFLSWIWKCTMTIILCRLEMKHVSMKYIVLFFLLHRNGCTMLIVSHFVHAILVVGKLIFPWKFPQSSSVKVCKVSLWYFNWWGYRIWLTVILTLVAGRGSIMPTNG